MSKIQIFFLFFFLPIVAPLLYPPRTLSNGLFAILFVIILFGILGFLLTRGNNQALTLSIFLQGLNAIVRLMMLLPGATFNDGSPNIVYIITSLLSIAISVYLLLRLDRVDIRTRMIS